MTIRKLRWRYYTIRTLLRDVWRLLFYGGRLMQRETRRQSRRKRLTPR